MVRSDSYELSSEGIDISKLNESLEQDLAVNKQYVIYHEFTTQKRNKYNV